MKIYEIQLRSIGDVKSFVETVCAFPEDIDLKAGRYTVDAKSIMGIFSLSLDKPMRMEIHGEEEERYQRLLKAYFTENGELFS